jgi:hypothetical protein
MLSPAKAVITRALVVAVWGAAMIAQPFAQQVKAAEASASPAPNEAVAATWVTGDIQPIDGTCTSRDNGSDGGVARSAYTCLQTSTSSDRRLTGDVTKSWNEDTYQTDEGPISVGVDALYLRNDDGGWSCSHGYVAKGSTPGTEPLTKSTFTCIGEGGYEGLTAVLVSEQVAGAYSGGFTGLIFPGDVPAVPEAPAGA